MVGIVADAVDVRAAVDEDAAGAVDGPVAAAAVIAEDAVGRGAGGTRAFLPRICADSRG